METKSTAWDVNYFSKIQALDYKYSGSFSIKFRGIERCIIRNRNGGETLVKQRALEEKEVVSEIPPFFLSGEETCNRYAANVLSKERIRSWIQHRIVPKISKDAIKMSHLLGEEDGFLVEAEVEVVKEIVLPSFSDNELEDHRIPTEHDNCTIYGEEGFLFEADVEVVKETAEDVSFKESELDGLQIPTEDVDCTICIEELWDGERKIMKLWNCSHKFHKDCILTWLGPNNSCPICRQKIFSSS